MGHIRQNAVAALAGLALLLLLPVLSGATEVIRLNGTGSSLAMMKILGEAYSREKPGVQVEIISNLGSSGAIKALLDGALDIAVTGREPKPAERSKGALSVKYGKSPYVFVTSRRMPKASITIPELEAIYGGLTTYWPDGQRIRRVLRPLEDTDTALLRAISPGMATAVAAAQKRQGMILAITDQDSLKAVAATKGSLGGGTLTQVLAERQKVQVFALNGVAPTAKHPTKGGYPLFKNHYIVTCATTSPAAKRFLEFVFSPAGRRVAAQYGFITAK